MAMVPPQFLTGLYGMNFVDPATGDPAIPELRYRHAYPVLLAVIGVYWAAVAAAIYRHGLFGRGAAEGGGRLAEGVPLARKEAAPSAGRSHRWAILGAR